MKILITGGLGYIGSNIALQLLKKKNSVLIIDNLSNSSKSKIKVIENLSKRKLFFKKADCKNKSIINKIFKTFKPELVIHLAGLKSVSESLAKPELYYEENFLSASVISDAMIKHNVKKLIFSSSATVYGKPKYLPLDEKHETNPENPYGLSKLMIEDYFKILSKNNKNFSVISLRYFNPVGADKSGKLSDNPKIPNNLFPKINLYLKNKLNFIPIYGNKYSTHDGTAIRDYIHIRDLAEAHIYSIDYFKKKKKFVVFNVGTGQGYSVLEIIKEFMFQNKINIKIKIKNKRKGDLPEIYSSVKKISKNLGWKSKLKLNDMCLIKI